MSDNAPWADFWVNAQKQFWDSWSDATMKSGIPTDGPNPAEFFQNSLEQWWKSMQPETTGDLADVYDKMLSSGRTYFEMAEEFLQNAASAEGNQLETVNQWLESMKCGFQNISEGRSVTDCKMPEFIDYWTSPVDTWKQMADSISPMHEGMQEGIFDAHKKSASTPVPEQLMQLFTLPAVGFYRESQEELQLLARLVVDYQQALRAYKAADAITTAKSLGAIQNRLKQMHESGEGSIESLRGVYDLWVEVFEETYAEFAMSEEYQTLYGRLVNSLMAVQQQGNKLIDQQYAKMNLPNRSEIDALEKRVYQMRRDNFKLRSTISDLSERLDKLEGADKAPAPKATPKAAPVAKKAAVKKKATVKKKTTVKKKAAAKRGA